MEHRDDYRQTDSGGRMWRCHRSDQKCQASGSGFQDSCSCLPWLGTGHDDGSVYLCGLRCHIRYCKTGGSGLWTCAGIGLSIGIGFYSGAAITTILVLVIYRFMGRVDEIAYEHSRVLDIYIEFESRRSIAPFISVLKQNNYKIVQMELNKSKKNKEELVNATLVLEVPEKTKHGIVIDLLREIPGIEYVEEI